MLQTKPLFFFFKKDFEEKVTSAVCWLVEIFGMDICNVTQCDSP
jgi:hypothetical protein